MMKFPHEEGKSGMSLKKYEAFVRTVELGSLTKAAEAMGAGPARIIARHLLPNTLSVVIVRVTLSIPSAIFSEAYLSYIGLGIPLPMCSWGSLAQLGIENFRIYPYQLIIPAICISLTMLAFNMFGDGLRDAFDPRLRR